MQVEHQGVVLGRQPGLDARTNGPLRRSKLARACSSANRSQSPFRLIYSARTPADVYYAGELRSRARDDAGLDVAYAYTRAVPDGWPSPPRRLGAAEINMFGWPAELAPVCFVCGPTGFVETVADILVALGHDPRRVKTERFGPTGG